MGCSETLAADSPGAAGNSPAGLCLHEASLQDPAPLETELAAATPVPGTGATRILMLGEGEDPASVRVGVADDGNVRSVTVRRDHGP